MTASPSGLALPQIVIDRLVGAALEEDLGRAGDITTNAIVPPDAKVKATIHARAPGRLSGIDVAAAAFRKLDDSIRIVAHHRDGDVVDPGNKVLDLEGRVRAILTAERVALNFLIHMSGIATETARYVAAVAGTDAAICCTRKTLPGLRVIQKYAVRCGGGLNHRFGLDDAVLIKDNHIAHAGDIGKAVERARRYAGHMTRISVEVDTIDQLKSILNDPIDVVLLDNMTTEELREAVKLIAGRVVTEASGGVNLDTVRGIAETGVDFISVGALTHSAPALDLGLDFAA